MTFLLVAALASQAAVWLDVPYTRQPDEGCGSAVAWMVAEYWAAATDHSGPVDSLENIHRELYSAELGGVSTTALEGFFRSREFHTFAFAGNMADIDEHLARGRPLIAVLEPGGLSSPLHFVVIAGVDPAEHVVLLNDPANRKLAKMDLGDFEKQWEGTNRWLLLAVPR